MSQARNLHPLLLRQLRKSDTLGSCCDGLIEMVSAAYFEFDRNRARTDHANAMMAEEIEQALAKLRTQNLRLRAALDNMSQSLCLFRADYSVAMCNRRFADLLGYPNEDELCDQSLEQVLINAPALAREGEDAVRRLLAEYAALRADQIRELVWPDGRTVEVHRVETADGGSLLTIDDISAAKQASEQISYLARHDALTDLPNRLMLRERMDEIVRNGRPDHSCAVIIMDLDRFKIVNDTLGHPIGDALLVQVAKRLKGLVRRHDVIARLGGDEFAIILQHVDDITEVSDLAKRVIARMAQPFQIKGNRITVGATLGISLQTISALDPAEALRQADVALYAAKADGRGVARAYTDEMHRDTQSRMRLEADLRDAMRRREFFVEYQPQLDLATREVVAVEALLRWQSPERGRVMPEQFIAACEEIGLIEEVGAFVLETAVRDALLWPERVVVAVNLSPVQFRSGLLPFKIAEVLAQAGLPPERLELEVTESLMIEDTGSVLAQIEDIKRLGCKISLDDFGTGYSSLSYIRQFPFDKIKIDKVFVRDLETSADSMAIIHAVSGLCASLSMNATAEGVENLEQLEILHRHRIDTAQGYLIGMPMPANLVAELIEAAGGRDWSDPLAACKSA